MSGLSASWLGLGSLIRLALDAKDAIRDKWASARMTTTLRARTPPTIDSPPVLRVKVDAVTQPFRVDEVYLALVDNPRQVRNYPVRERSLFGIRGLSKPPYPYGTEIEKGASDIFGIELDGVQKWLDAEAELPSRVELRLKVRNGKNGRVIGAKGTFFLERG